MTRRILMNTISVFFILTILLSLVSCSYDQAKNKNKEGTVISPYEPINSHEGTTFGFSAMTDSTSEAGRIDSNLVIEDLNEPITINFGQVGKDRKVIMHVYYDFLPVNFKVGSEGNFDNNFKFELKDRTEIGITLLLDPDINMDNQAHKIMFEFTPGYDEYAMDKLDSAYKPSISNLYQLHFGEYIEFPKIPQSNYPLDTPNNYYDHSFAGLMLNTDISNLSAKEYSGVATPEKYYSVSPNKEFNLNYVITNISQPAKTALIYLTVGNQVVDINNQNYIWVDLKNSSMTVGVLTFNTPREVGLHDVIGHIVYDPFETLSHPEQSLPQSSVRFTIEVQ